MATYIKGIGDEATRKNEILPTFDARINKFIVGHDAGICQGNYKDFYTTAIDRGVVVSGGMVQAYGFFGLSDTEKQFNFVMPSSLNYVHIYAEIDLSVVPNVFDIKTTPMSNSSSYAFRKDDLNAIPNGKYQIQLYRATLTASSIILVDMREYITKVKAANSSETAVTQPQSDNSTRVATTAYVRRSISDAFNITEADIKTSAGDIIGKVRRQGNFVICEGNGYGVGYGTTATIPEGFRPKTMVQLGVSSDWLAQSMYPHNQVEGGAWGRVSSDGTLTVTVQNHVHQYLAVIHRNANFYGGWEITA